MKKLLCSALTLIILFCLSACSERSYTPYSPEETSKSSYDYGDYKISDSTLKDVAKSEVAVALYEKIDRNRYSYGCDPDRTKVDYTDYEITSSYSYSTVVVRGKCWLYNSYNDYVDSFKFDCKVEIYNDGKVKQCYFPTINFY